MGIWSHDRRRREWVNKRKRTRCVLFLLWRSQSKECRARSYALHSRRLCDASGALIALAILIARCVLFLLWRSQSKECRANAVVCARDDYIFDWAMKNSTPATIEKPWYIKYQGSFWHRLWFKNPICGLFALRSCIVLLQYWLELLQNRSNYDIIECN